MDELENHMPADVDAKELEKVQEGKKLRVKQDYSKIQVDLLPLVRKSYGVDANLAICIYCLQGNYNLLLYYI